MSRISSFSEFVRCLADDQQIGEGLIAASLDWPERKRRRIRAGTLQARDLTLAEACELAFLLNVSVADLADAAGVQ